MSTRTIVTALIGTLVVLFAAWFLNTHDRVSTQDWVGPTGEARLRPFLAAQRLADRMGIEAEEIRSIPELDELPADSILILPAGRQEMHSGMVADLVRWVERGGHLIVEAETLGVPDPLLDRLGVTRARAESMRKPLSVVAPDGRRKLTVYFGDAMQIDADAANVHYRVAENLISFSRRQGRVTAATSLHFARNPGYEDHAAQIFKRPARSIGAHDHAELFWQIVSSTPDRLVQVYFRPERLSLWDFLTANAAPALAATGLLLLLWLWSIAPRFGPVAPDQPPGRRRLLDHLRASGRFYWAQGLRSRLVVAARDAALRRVARAQPDFAGASPAEKATRLSLLAGITKEEAARFMSAAGAMRGADFIRIAQHAQLVHRALEKGARK